MTAPPPWRGAGGLSGPMARRLASPTMIAPLDIAGTTFEPDTGFAASEIRASAIFSVDGQDAEGALRSDRITETDILDGRWDNAAIEVWRVNWADTSQRVLMRRGTLGQIRRGKQVFVAEVRSLTHFLNQTGRADVPVVLRRALGRCALRDRSGSADLLGHGRRHGPVGRSDVHDRGAGRVCRGLVHLGRVKWTSGANAGRGPRCRPMGCDGGIATSTLMEAPVRAIARATAFSSRRAATSSSRPVAPSSAMA